MSRQRMLSRFRGVLLITGILCALFAREVQGGVVHYQQENNKQAAAPDTEATQFEESKAKTRDQYYREADQYATQAEELKKLGNYLEAAELYAKSVDAERESGQQRLEEFTKRLILAKYFYAQAGIVGWVMSELYELAAVLPALLEALKDKNVDIRVAAAQALGYLGSKTAVPALLEALRDKDAGVRAATAQALGYIRDKTAVPALLDALKDKDVGVRDAAAVALAHIGDKMAVPALLDALKDQDADVRAATAWALQIGDKTVIPALLEALKDKNVDVRIAAAQALGQIGDKTAVPALLEALKDQDADVREEAAWALGQIGDKTVIPTLLEALKDQDADVREEAARALGKIGDKAAVPVLLEVMKDKDKWVRTHAAEALGQIGDKNAVPALLEALKDEDWRVRDEAAEALGEISDKTALPALLKALKDQDADVREVAARALEQIGDKTTVPALLDALKDEDWRVRIHAAEALGQIGDKNAVTALINVLKDGEHWIPRAAAAKALGQIGDKNAVPALLNALKDENWGVRDEAAEALGEISDKAALPALLEALKDKDVGVRAAARALGKIGDKTAVPALLDALKDQDADVRAATAWALGQIGDKRAVPALVNVLEDSPAVIDPFVSIREIAATALQKMNEREPLTVGFYETTDIFIFNLLRKHLLFSDNLESHVSVEDQFLKSATFYLLALQAREQGQYQKQIEYAEQALTLADPKIETALAILSLWLKTQAELKLNRPQDALQTITTAEDLLGYLSPQEREDYEDLFEEQTFFFKGEVLIASGENETAIETYKNSLEHLEWSKRRWWWVEKNEHAEKLEAMIRTGLGMAHKELSRTNLEQAVTIGQKYQSANSLEMESEEKRYLELAKYEMAEGNYERAQALIEELNLRRQRYLNRRLELQLSDPDKQQTLEEYQRRKRQIENIARQISQLAGQSQRDEAKLKALEQQRSRAKRELQQYITTLKQKQPDLAMLLGARPIELAAVQARLPADTALLQYVVLSDRIIVFVIKTASVNIVEIPVSKADLTTEIEDFRAALRVTKISLPTPNLSQADSGLTGNDTPLRRPPPFDGTQDRQGGNERGEVVNLDGDAPPKDWQTLSKDLYRLLLQPVIKEGHLQGITQLGIAPNGVLHYLPFEVLHNGQVYLLENYLMFYINSTSLLWVALDRTQSGRDGESCLLAFGNPDGSLRYADSEVDRIAPLFACKTVYHQQDVKKAHIHTADLLRGVLHFATHGVFRSNNSTQSYLQMADGKLTVAEIWGLPLTGLRFTTLSACQTGVGEILSGDDIVSLETAFIFAGSPTVIATLWKVDDQATSELMLRFYQHLLTGNTKAAALRAAKQELQHQEQYRHPYYWAAFTLRGVWN